MTRARLWPLVAWGWLWSLAALEPATNAGWSLLWQLLLYPSGFLVGILWIQRSPFHPDVPPSWRAVGVWVLVPTALIAVLVLSATNYGLALRVRLCEDELRTFAESARDEDVGAHGPHGCRVGAFYVHRTYGFGPEVRMITALGMNDRYGIMYWPGDTPPTGCEYLHLYGPWYRYETDS